MNNRFINTTTKGTLGESKAIEFLVNNNFKIIGKNFSSKFGEIDVIAKKDEVMHFIEVKSGFGFEPIYNITPSKIKKITKTLYAYMKKNRIDTPFCIDAIIIENNRLEFIENITL